MSQLCPDIIAFVESPRTHPDRWVLMNVFSRQCLGVGPEVMAVLASPDVGAAGKYRTWNIWRFSHIDGLLADPSRFKRDSSTWGDPRSVDHAALIKLLKEQCILIDDFENYRKRFDFKTSLLDRQRFGTYHQELGQQLITVERRDPAAWWLEQKFTPNLSAIRADNLYGAVQDAFLEKWLPQRIKPGLHVLDLGCGAGTIAQKIARLGATVVGVDPNPDYIRLANERVEGDVKFQVLDLNRPDALSALPAASFDYIYMSDALLFYFVPYEPAKPLDLNRFICEVKRLLKPAGKFLSLEPHPVFYVQPWLGDPARPFTFMTEYLHTKWRINPSLGTLTRPFLNAGFTISAVEELSSAPSNTNVEKRAAYFAAEFPVWLLLEFTMTPKL